MTCPTDCKVQLKTIEKKIEGHSLTLYDKDGRGGLTAGYESLKNCMGKFITRKGGIATTLAILTMLTVLGVYGLTAWSGEKEKRSGNTSNIKVTESRLETIEITVNDIHDTQKQLIRDRIKPDQLMEMIKAAVKEGNEP